MRERRLCPNPDEAGKFVEHIVEQRRPTKVLFIASMTRSSRAGVRAREYDSYGGGFERREGGT
jgi:hypothetical protein